MRTISKLRPILPSFFLIIALVAARCLLPTLYAHKSDKEQEELSKIKAISLEVAFRFTQP